MEKDFVLFQWEITHGRFVWPLVINGRKHFCIRYFMRKTWGSLGDFGSCRPLLTSKSVYFRCIFHNPLILCTDLSLIKWTIFLQQISPQSQSKVRLVNVLENLVALYLHKNMEILSATWEHILQFDHHYKQCNATQGLFLVFLIWVVILEYAYII